jgi:2-oxoisovalerate dehydrogenase E1 component
MGFWYKENVALNDPAISDLPLVVWSLGDASVTEGEVAEAFQMAVLKQLPILYLVQDNEWDISAHASEIKAQNASEYAKGFKGLEVRTIDGTDFMRSYKTVNEMLHIIRTERRPMLLHAKVPLLNHHTSGVRKEWYRHDLEDAAKRDPFPRLKNQLILEGITIQQLNIFQLFLTIN